MEHSQVLFFSFPLLNRFPQQPHMSNEVKGLSDRLPRPFFTDFMTVNAR